MGCLAAFFLILDPHCFNSWHANVSNHACIHDCVWFDSVHNPNVFQLNVVLVLKMILATKWDLVKKLVLLVLQMCSLSHDCHPALLSVHFIICMLTQLFTRDFLSNKSFFLLFTFSNLSSWDELSTLFFFKHSWSTCGYGCICVCVCGRGGCQGLQVTHTKMVRKFYLPGIKDSRY